MSKFEQTEYAGMPYDRSISLYLRPDEHPSAILLTDDDDSVRKLVKKCLEKAGCTVFAAGDGVVGLAFFKQKRQEIALLLTDVELPNMMAWIWRIASWNSTGRCRWFSCPAPSLPIAGTGAYRSRSRRLS